MTQTLPPRWVCDVCMTAVTRDQIGDTTDGEHVICANCLAPITVGGHIDGE